MNQLIKKIAEIGIVPVITIENAADAVPLGKALMAGGISVAEITFRTPAAADAIAAMAKQCPEMIVGAGTVLTLEQANAARAAGAMFIVTPGFDPNIVDHCIANGLPIVPGVMTPTEINMALAQGIDVVKFFPAHIAGGVDALKAIGAPYGGVKFMPTGGVNINNLADYLQLPQVVACGGSWLASKSLLAEHAFKQITCLAAKAVAVVQECRR